jgi:hypothetical protein
VRSSHSPDQIAVSFDDDHAVADAGLILAASLAEGLVLRELFDAHVDLGEAPGAANVGDKAMTLIHSALAGGEWIGDADRLPPAPPASSSATGLPRRPRSVRSCARSPGDRPANSTRSPSRRCAGRGQPAPGPDHGR